MRPQGGKYSEQGKRNSIMIIIYYKSKIRIFRSCQTSTTGRNMSLVEQEHKVIRRERSEVRGIRSSQQEHEYRKERSLEYKNVQEQN